MGFRGIKLGSLIVLALLLALIGAVTVYASSPHNGGHHYGKSNEQTGEKGEGLGGASGQTAAWLLGIANFPVVLSILLKTYSKLPSRNSHLKESMERMNLRQKAYLMKLHYWLNPVAVIVAIIHFLFTQCETTAMPEIGLGAMLVVCILGMMVIFKWSPPAIRKAVFQFHTSSLFSLAIISILLVGHSMVD
jgi:hypothetical protein